MPVSRAGTQGQLWSVIRRPTTPAVTPPAYPADRSISPIRSTNTRPIAKVAMAEPCRIRLEKLKALVNFEPVRMLKTITRTIRPAIAGREPTSPPFTRVT